MPELHKNPFIISAPSPHWLECTISPGMFRTEVVASATTASGNWFSLFVPTTFVLPNTAIEGPTQGLLAVNVLETKDDLVMVSLPAEPLESSQTVTVRQKQLRAA